MISVVLFIYIKIRYDNSIRYVYLGIHLFSNKIIMFSVNFEIFKIKSVSGIYKNEWEGGTAASPTTALLGGMN